MPLQFTVLASGSSGNASLLDANGVGVLLDIGIGPRVLSGRLARVGASWDQVKVALLTHTHSDHWKDTTLTQLHRRRIPLYCHDGHRNDLRRYAAVFDDLEQLGLVREYQAGVAFSPVAGLSVRPVPVRHDGGPTFAFRVEGSSDLFGRACSLAYAADLGSWTAELAHALADVDLLALEFNHDVQMEYASGRSPYLIARVLGEEGHLSNEQAAELLRAVLRLSRPGRLRHVVQLHLSRDCNHPELAVQAARAVLEECQVIPSLHTASQHEPAPTLCVDGLAVQPVLPRPVLVRAPRKRQTAAQPWLPGIEGW